MPVKTDVFRALRSIASVGALALLLLGCSLRDAAMNGVGSALARSSESWATDDDPELVRDAAPFALKTIESLLAESPDDPDLLLAATRDFTQYAYGWVQQDADYAESEDLARALALRARARGLYRRALRYGLHAIELRAPGWRTNPERSLGRFGKDDVPLLYWTAAAWGSAISLSKDDSELSADVDLVERLMSRALELDEGYNLGAIHDLYIVWYGGRPASAGGSAEIARTHLERARAISAGHRAAPLVAFAETVSVSTQNRAEFRALLEEAIAIDVDAVPGQRLTNLIYQKRARWLLSRVDDLFVE
jgi:predicted anti-sigma-YlaC factor YlaD